MVFSSLPFLFGFFPVVILLYFSCSSRVWRNGVLLAASLVFYAWGEPRFLGLMLLATLVAYGGGWAIDWATRRGKPGTKKAACAATVILLVANLFVFKYLDFALENISALLGLELPLVGLVLPIGISFYTFQILSYVIDLYRGQVALQKNFFYLALYVSFFPQLIAGPIVRYQTVEQEIRVRRETLADAAVGVKRFIVGLGKKVILSNGISSVATAIYAADPEIYGSAMYWLAAVAYALHIYFDFSGYSDMAIGLGRIFGFHFLENFDHPYVALSITDFWRRWHISLSSWFRDYIYIPLGGNRVRRRRWVINLLVVWGLTGLWHGAQWNFLLWGLYYGLLLLLEKLVLAPVLEKLPIFARWLYTMFFVTVGWVFFNLTDVGEMTHALAMMFTFRPTDWLGAVAANASVLYGLFFIPAGLICMLPIRARLVGRLERTGWGYWVSNLLHAALLAVCVVVIVSSRYNPFIYFRF